MFVIWDESTELPLRKEEILMIEISAWVSTRNVVVLGESMH